MAKLVDVYRNSQTLSRRQLPLVVDETLTMVMDLKSLSLIADSHHVKAKELDEFTRKVELLTEEELSNALEVSRSEILHVLNQSVPCVGCRRSVERLYYQLFKYGYPTLDPIIVKTDGIVTVKEDKQNSAQFLCGLFHGHSARLNNLVDSQPRRNKKSHRCLLHSLDSQRSRPITPAWRDVWDCMRPDCRRDVCIIEASSLSATLDTYLRKHRFCGECRTKVLKAYSLLIDDPNPCKEKGYVTSLYSGIKRCITEQHIHLPATKTEYIARLIGRAEPELLGSRRERHAKTLEIAQEEVLTCIGICMYERLHRVYMRMREEECTCQVLAAVAVDALWRRFETVIENKQGISQLELLYAELTREEQQKQLRKEQKKLRRKRKKEKTTTTTTSNSSNATLPKSSPVKTTATTVDDSSSLANGYTCHEDDDEEYEEEDDDEEEEEDEEDEEDEDEDEIDEEDEEDCDHLCEERCLSCALVTGGRCGGKSPSGGVGGKKTEVGTVGDVCKCDNGNSVGRGKEKKGGKGVVVGGRKKSPYRCDNYRKKLAAPGGGGSDHSHDCGYSSENNNGCCETGSILSSLPSSPEGSEVACSDDCCPSDNNHHHNHHHTDYIPSYNNFYGNKNQLSLLEMLDDPFYCDDDTSFITPEEVNEFKSNNRQVFEKRQQLRETLQRRFADLCVNGPLQVPRLLAQHTKYASN